MVFYNVMLSVLVTYITFFNKIMLKKVSNPKLGYLVIFFSLILIVFFTLNEIFNILKKKERVMNVDNAFKIFLSIYCILIFFTTKYSGRIVLYILIPLAIYKVYKEKKYNITNLEIPILFFLFGILLSSVNSLYKKEVIDNFFFSIEGYILPLLLSQFNFSKDSLKIIFSIGFIGMIYKASKAFLELAGYINPLYEKVRISGGEEVFKYAPVIMMSLIAVIIYLVFENKKILKEKITLIYFGVLSFIIIIISQNRANWLAIVVILFLLTLEKINKKVIIGTVVLMAMLFGLELNNFEESQYYKRLKTMTSAKELSNDVSFLIRIEIAEEGLKIFRNNYLTGIGYSKKSYAKAQNYVGYKYISEGTNHIEAHNTYIQSLASTGIIGFLGYVVMLGSLFFKFIKKDDIYSKLALYTIIGIQINGLFVSILEYKHVTGIYFLIIGLGLSYHKKNYHTIKFITKKTDDTQ